MESLKVLVVHTASLPDEKVMPVDLWRVWRPIRELKKHVDWQITERPTVIEEKEEYKDRENFTDEELEKAAEELGQYDVIYGSYSAFMNPSVFTLCMVVEKRYGTKLILDVDDNVFAINPDNIGWWMKMSHGQTLSLQQIVRNVHFMTCTTDIMAKVLHEYNPEAVIAVVPNYISKDYSVDKKPNERIRIGYFGGASHFGDLHDTGVLDAVQRIMHEYKNVEFYTCGMPIEHYLPKQRSFYNAGKRGHAWVTEVFPSLNYDICLAPLKVNDFNKCKSDIKWQEAAMMKAPLIASKVSPYKETIHNGIDGYLVANDTMQWYHAIQLLVVDKKERLKIADEAYQRVNNERLIENNWSALKQAIETMHRRYQKQSTIDSLIV